MARGAASGTEAVLLGPVDPPSATLGVSEPWSALADEVLDVGFGIVAFAIVRLDSLTFKLDDVAGLAGASSFLVMLCSVMLLWLLFRFSPAIWKSVVTYGRHQ